LPTYHEKIMIAKVRRQDIPEIRKEFESLILLARRSEGSMEIVAKMKELVPEFVSNNSIFESLDGEKTEAGNVVSISRVS